MKKIIIVLTLLVFLFSACQPVSPSEIPTTQEDDELCKRVEGAAFFRCYDPLLDVYCWWTVYSHGVHCIPAKDLQ